MKSKRNQKPWKKGDFSKELTPRYTPVEADVSFMTSIMLDQDPFYIAFNKPSGLACQTRSPEDRTFDKLLAVFARSNGKQPRLVHRLDAQTSGVILAAKTKPAAAFFSAAFENRSAMKTYLALCEGEAFNDPSGQIVAPLERYQEKPNLTLGRVAIEGAGEGQTAKTGYEVLSSAGRYHLLRLSPATGRMHQIRVHLAHIGRPILGDPYYGDAKAPDAAPVVRLMLHASQLRIPHPERGEIDLHAPMPQDMILLGGALGLEMELASKPETS